MVFNSLVFAGFFAVVCVLMMLTNTAFARQLPGRRVNTVRHGVLLVASYIFYGWWDWRFAFLMLALTGTAYFCSLKLERTGKRIYLWIAVVVPLIILGIFKYLNFFMDSFAALTGIKRMNGLKIILPVGISFYTFQALSYTIDVHRGKIRAESSFLKLALYIAFFPQLVAGPIVKAGDFLPQLHEDRSIGKENFCRGIQYFVFGLFKKVVLADHLSVCVDAVFAHPGQYHAISILFAVAAYSMQIYCDFSGYSDMTIGCAKCLGYDLPRNFNLPYISENVSVFWKRWHISLSSWLMEYLYIPLGGNRRGAGRTYVNLFLTMLIGGLWHGAEWTFVAWGALHGAALCVHKLWMKICGRYKKDQRSAAAKAVSALTTYIFVCFCWILFRAPDFGTAGAVIRGVFTWQPGVVYISSWTVVALVLAGLYTAVAAIRSVRQKTAPEAFYPQVDLNTIAGQTIFFVALGLTLGLAYTGSNQFIYFQF